jgi:membrane-bound lytic murein transglycosylase MltF
MKNVLTIGRISYAIVLTLLFYGGALAQRSASAPADQISKRQVRQLEISIKSWTGDFSAMLERRIIRVLVPYSRSLYFNDSGRERGIAADNVRDFEQWLNRKYEKRLRNRPLTVVIIPTTRDKLLSGLVQGLGDISAANLTITPERLKSVDFSPPDGGLSVKEVVVTGSKSPAIASTADLAGKTVHVRRTSSYYESLMALNERFRREGKPAVKLVLVPDALEDEDMLEMVNAGLLQAVVVDDWVARMWSQILPRIRVNGGAVLREEGRIGWAIRKGSPKLSAEIVEFHQRYLKNQGVLPYRLKQYMSRVKQIKDATGASEWKRFDKTLALFRKYGDKYHFDPLMLAAQGFQESQLKQERKSPRGAIGVMQVMPATGKELKVGNIRVIEPNIHAGTKYMDQLMTRYFSDANFTGNNRTLFAFACYNCGPGNVAKMRKEAEKRGLNPNEWFNNVEIVTAQRIGMETTTYVRNIFKYYVAYKLQLEAMEAVKKAREKVAPVTGK